MKKIGREWVRIVSSNGCKVINKEMNIYIDEDNLVDTLVDTKYIKYNGKWQLVFQHYNMYGEYECWLEEGINNEK